MRKLTIVESYTEPNKDNLWFYGGTLKWFSANGWEMVNMQPQLPTTTTTTTQPPETNLRVRLTLDYISSVGYIVQIISTDYAAYPNDGIVEQKYIDVSPRKETILEFNLDSLVSSDGTPYIFRIQCNSSTSLLPFIGYYDNSDGSLITNLSDLTLTIDKYSYDINIKYDILYTTTTSTTSSTPGPTEPTTTTTTTTPTTSSTPGPTTINYDIPLQFITDDNTAYRFKIIDSNLIGYNIVGYFDEHIFIKESSSSAEYQMMYLTVSGNGDLKAIFNSDNIQVPNGTTVTQISINDLQYTLGTEVILSKDIPNKIQVFIKWNNKINLHLKYSDTNYKVNFSVRDSGGNNILNYIPTSPFFIQDGDLETSIPSPSHEIRLVYLESITNYDYGCAKLSSGQIIEFTANQLPLQIAGANDNITDITIYPGTHADEIETVFPPENTTTTTPVPIS